MKKYKLSDIFFTLFLASVVVLVLWLEVMLIKWIYVIEGLSMAICNGIGCTAFDFLFAALLALE